MAKKKLLQKMTYQKGSILEKEKVTSLMNLETHNSEIELVETNSEITYVYITIGDYGVNGSISSAIDYLTANNYFGNIYPNPASGFINVEVDLPVTEPLTYTIYNQKGVEVLSGPVMNETASFNHMVDISGLPQGIYFLNYRSGEGFNVNRKFVKQ